MNQKASLWISTCPLCQKSKYPLRWLPKRTQTVSLFRFALEAFRLAILPPSIFGILRFKIADPA